MLNKPSDSVRAQKVQAEQLYEQLTGGVTRRIAESAIAKHLPPLTSSTRILDSASGPGVVTQLILDRAAAAGVDPPPRITAVDVSEGMIGQLVVKKDALGWKTVDHAVLDATELRGLPDGEFDAVIMNFGIFALLQAGKGAAEIRRVLKPGGVAIVTTWKYTETMTVMEKAVQEIRPQDLDRVWPISKDWLKEEKLRDTLIEGGFAPGDVQISSEDNYWQSASVEGFVEALDSPFWQQIKEGWSDEDIARWRPTLRRLTGPGEADGSVKKAIIAWIGVAKKV